MHYKKLVLEHNNPKNKGNNGYQLNKARTHTPKFLLEKKELKIKTQFKIYIIIYSNR